MITDLQKKTAQAIVNIFETGRLRGDYGKVTFHPADFGHLTYGRSQTTLASGNLYLLIKAYCDVPNAQFREKLSTYLGALAHKDTVLDHDMVFRDCLTEAGKDPVMCDVQDAFFERVYWAPSASDAAGLNIHTALGLGVVYDSHVHGSWGLIRDRVVATRPAGEQEWIDRYVKERRQWLATHSNTLLQRTVYRMDAFVGLIAANQWDLPLPLRVRGMEITETGLQETLRVSAEDGLDRTLRWQTPLLSGADVLKLQEALVSRKLLDAADGIFGVNTAAAVKKFQNDKHLTADGVVGPVTRAALGL